MCIDTYISFVYTISNVRLIIYNVIGYKTNLYIHPLWSFIMLTNIHTYDISIPRNINMLMMLNIDQRSRTPYYELYYEVVI